MSTKEDYVRVKLSFGGAELEVEGPRDYVDQNASRFLSAVAGVAHEVTVESEAYEEKNDTSLLMRSSDMSYDASFAHESVTDTEVSQSTNYNLVTLYLKIQPKNQTEEILMITFYYQDMLGFEILSLQDYIDAYEELRQIPVEVPSNMKSSVRNVVDRKTYLYNPERGKFALTMTGKQYLKEIGLRGE